MEMQPVVPGPEITRHQPASGPAPRVLRAASFGIALATGLVLLAFWFDQPKYAAVALCGMLLGSAELASRYRDSPLSLFTIEAAWFYVTSNALLSCAALWVVLTWPAVATTVGIAPEQRAVYDVLLAGFGGAAFFRSSFAKTKINDVEIGIGPSFVIDVLLAVSDRLIDRHRAEDRAEKVPRIMRDIPPDFAAKSLTEYCVALMQNLSAQDERTLKSRVDAYFKTELPGSVKSILIGLVLSQYVGYGPLELAKRNLEAELAEARRKPLIDVSDAERMLKGGKPPAP